LLFALRGLLQTDPLAFLTTLLTLVIAVLVAISVHEFSHAWASNHLGDDTARRLGRLSLNPLRHLDPLGTLMLFFVGFGWGRPVPVNPYRLRYGVKTGMALVSVAGPLSNFATAGILGLAVRFNLLGWHSPVSYAIPFSQTTLIWVLSSLLGFVIFFNIILGIFNLLPIAPLDGFKVVLGILPSEAAYSWARLERYGPVILLGLVGMDMFFGTGILWGIISPALTAATTILVGRPFL
jgi:Zn-dependent protease